MTIARVGGIPIRVDPTWLIAFLVVTWSLGQGLFPAEHPGWSPATYWVAGATGALLLFGSVLVHELSHAAVARRIGLSVGGITLFVFGGVATVDEEATRPRDELLMAAAGPATSLLLAGGAWLAVGLATPLHEPSAAVLGYVALANASLALFNLLPGFPLDGGRVLRAALWARGRDRRGATRTAGRLGEAMAVMLIILGGAEVLGGDPISGLWVAFVGWFLRGAAIAERRGSELADTLGKVEVALLMRRCPTVEPDLPLDVFVHEHAIRGGDRAAAVLVGGRLLGVVSATDAGRVPRERWPVTPVSVAMTTAELATVEPTTDVARALALMTRRGVNQLLVVRDGEVVGMLDREAIVRYVALGRPEQPDAERELEEARR